MLSERYSDLELHLARDIEICLGPYQTTEARREAMEALLSNITDYVKGSERDVVLSAARIAGINL